MYTDIALTILFAMIHSILRPGMQTCKLDTRSNIKRYWQKVN